MTTRPTLRFRIKSAGGTLFVREMIDGAVIARIPSESKTTDPASAALVAAKCEGAFLGPVESVSHEGECVFVTCVVAPRKAEREVNLVLAEGVPAPRPDSGSQDRH